MKKHLISLVLTGITIYSGFAQDGTLIDPTNSQTRNNSAALEVYSTNQGFLTPRVALSSTTDAATITGTEPNGLLVYNTNSSMTGGSEGFYYWNGSSWQRLINGNGNFVSGTGTQNYVTKWNNTAGTTIGNSQIFDDATNVGIGSAVPGQKLDVAGAIKLGTTTTTAAGTIRWNSTTNDFESYDGTRWWSLTGLHERTMNYTNDGF